ncbi:MAG: hypothetical protein IPK66_02555 [Rhodospirillales bacterium]|nr:hypothetical protein [Rhodospirillales bacterium]
MTEESAGAKREERHPQATLDDAPPRYVRVPRCLAEAWSSVRKSGTIGLHGIGVLNSAFFGTVWMTVDDAFVSQRARTSCRTLGSLLDFDRDRTAQALTDLTARIGVLTRIALQLGEDVAYPLQRRVYGLLEKFAEQKPT